MRIILEKKFKNFNSNYLCAESNYIEKNEDKQVVNVQKTIGNIGDGSADTIESCLKLEEKQLSS